MNRAVVGVLSAVFPPNIIASILGAGAQDDLTFEPVRFAPGSNALDETGRAYLDRLAALMAEHPQVILTVCGRAVDADTAPIGAMLANKLGPPGRDDRKRSVRIASHAGALAVERTRSVRRHLVVERGVDPATVTECRALFDSNDEGPPRVDIAL